jgi:hypothetical protein
MNYKYHIRRVNWNSKKERDFWFNDALVNGLKNDYIITENIDDIEEFSFYLGDDFFDMNKILFTERDIRIINWLKENHPELLI